MSFASPTPNDETRRLKRDLDSLSNRTRFYSPQQNTLYQSLGVNATTAQKAVISALFALRPSIHTIHDLNSNNVHTTIFDKITLKSSSVLVDGTGTSLTVKTIFGTTSDGQIILIKPVAGKTLTLKSGDNINITSDITISDNAFALLQYQENSGNKYNVLVSNGEGTGGTANIKQVCKVATTGNNLFHPLYNTTIDGITVSVNDRVLVKNQSTQRDNGIYYVYSIAGGTATLARATDMANASTISGNILVSVDQGTANKDTLWLSENTTTKTVGLDPIVFTIWFSGGGDNLGNHTATQALNMNDNIIFFDTAQTAEILYSSGMVYNTTAGTGHDFWVDILNATLPSVGILANSLESNVKLNMNNQKINFDTSQTRYIQTNSSDGLYYVVPSSKSHWFHINNTSSYIFGITSGGVSTSVPVLMNNHEIQDVRYVDFYSSNNDQKIDTSSDGKVFNFYTNGNIRMNVSEDSNVSGVFEMFGNGPTQMSNVYPSAVKVVSKTTGLGNNTQTIGALTYDMPTNTGIQKSFGIIYGQATNSTNNSEKGKLNFAVLDNSGTFFYPKTILSLDGTGASITGNLSISGTFNPNNIDMTNHYIKNIDYLTFVNNAQTDDPYKILLNDAGNTLNFQGYGYNVMNLTLGYSYEGVLELRGYGTPLYYRTPAMVKTVSTYSHSVFQNVGSIHFDAKNNLGTQITYAQINGLIGSNMTSGTEKGELSIYLRNGAGNISEMINVSMDTGVTVLNDLTVTGTIFGNMSFTQININTTAETESLLSFYRNDSTPNNNDIISRIRFYGNNTALSKVQYAEIKNVLKDKTTGQHLGQIVFLTQTYDSSISTLKEIARFDNLGLTMGNKPIHNIDYLDFYNNAFSNVSWKITTNDSSGSAGNVLGFYSYNNVIMNVSVPSNNRSVLEMRNTVAITNDINAPPSMIKAVSLNTPTLDSYLGSVHFDGYNGNSTSQITYGQITTSTRNITTGSEAGKMWFHVRGGGGLVEMMNMKYDGINDYTVQVQGKLDVQLQADFWSNSFYHYTNVNDISRMRICQLEKQIVSKLKNIITR